jgi:hypothetical protein
MLVGYYQASQTHIIEPLTVLWNGLSWASLANPAGDGTVLTSVSCSTPTFCVAVGYSENPGISAAIAEIWNGTTWTLRPPPNPAEGTGGYSSLEGVACTGPSTCQAVGIYYDNGTYPSLIEVWSGSAWTIVTSPNVPDAENNLTSISCTSDSACMAVASRVLGGHRGHGEWY